MIFKIRYIIFLTFVCISTTVIQAQNCYEKGMNESKVMFNEAQRLQSIGKEDEAAQKFLEAFKKAQDTEKNCKDKPTDETRHPDTANKDNKQTENQDIKSTHFYVNVIAGISGFGTVSLGDLTNNISIVYSADVAYFFNKWFGVGVIFNMANCKAEIDEKNSYNDQITFFGAGLYGRCRKNFIEFNAGVTAGSLGWKMTNIKIADFETINQSASTFGLFLSSGVNFIVSKNFGITLCAQSALGTIKNKAEIERNPASAGVMAGVSVRF